MLQFYSFKTNSNIVEIDYQMIKDLLNIKSNTALKSALTNLYENSLITTNITTLPRNGRLTIEITSTKEHESFVRLPSDLLRWVKDISCLGYRLLYYYESYINRTSSGNFCYCSFKTIQEELGLSPATLAKYNNLLKKHKLLKITKHQLKPTYSYDDFDRMEFKKYNNHYIPLIENMFYKI